MHDIKYQLRQAVIFLASVHDDRANPETKS